MKRFIEEDFPIKEISKESVKEKSIRHGHISTLHLWWARRPLASSRSTIYSALIPYTSDSKSKKKDFIVNLALWKNSLNVSILKEARKHVKENNTSLRILDPFGGGGSIPLEATRLGCETYTGDYNPVATLILKCGVEFPQRYREKYGNTTSVRENKLLTDIKKWAGWVLQESTKELQGNYGNDEIGYIWSRVIHCQNPKCRKEIPIFKQYWLSNKPNKKIALFSQIKSGKIIFRIVGDGYNKMPKDFDPSKGNISRAVITCSHCGFIMDPVSTRKTFFEKKYEEILIAKIIKSKIRGKTYQIVDNADAKLASECEKKLETIIKKLQFKWQTSPVPDEPIEAKSQKPRALWVYGMKTWGDMYNARQKLALLTFADKIRDAYHEILKQESDKEYAKALVTYLSLNFDRVLAYCSSLCVWHVTGEKMAPTFPKHTFTMHFDYTESNPISDAYSWSTNLKWILKVVKHCSEIPIDSDFQIPQVSRLSAQSLSFDDGFFDAIVTDPPYYDNVNYAELSDYFYVWQKRILGDIYPDLFVTPLSPKQQEIISNPKRHDGVQNAKQFFEENLSESFSEINRVLKPDGIAVIVYAHKSTHGWETLINALLNSGLSVTSVWPIKTEMPSASKAGTASLASSLYMVARKSQEIQYGFYRDVKKELKSYVNAKLDQLWNQGVSGSDFFIAAIGSAIEVFGKYKKIVDDTDKPVPVLKLLDDTRKIATDYTINKIMCNESSVETSSLTKFYILWRWIYKESKVPYDDAKKLAQSTGISLEQEWNKGFIIKDGGDIRIIGPDEHKIDEPKDMNEIIDVLHHVLVLWKNSKHDEINQFLKEVGYKISKQLKIIAQAISESLSDSSTEKKWIEGFLTGFDISETKDDKQTKLF